MRSLNDITLLGLVSIVLLLLAVTAQAEVGPTEGVAPPPAAEKKSFGDLFSDPSAILDLEDDEFSDLLPPLEQEENLERKVLGGQPSFNMKAPTLASPILPLGQPQAAANAAYPPFLQDPQQMARMNANAPGTFLALPFVLSPEFFMASSIRAPSNAPDRLPLPHSTPMNPMPGVPDVAVILSHTQFFPSSVRLKEGLQTRLIFTTTNKRPAALVVERLQIQRWIAKEDEQKASSTDDRIRWEVSRELNVSRIAEIVIDPKKGVYSFQDVLSGATGEIIVE